jgi:hypothetical protein
MIFLFAALLLAAEPQAAAAQDAAPAAASAPATPPPAKKAKDQVICWDETPTGTLFTKHVCATREQLEERRRNDQDWKMGLRVHPTGAN